MELEHTSEMYETHDKIVTMLESILEPAPLNQLGMSDYCRQKLIVLDEVKKMIEELQSSYRTLLHSYDITMNEEF
jgi:hypothetical protein